MNDPRHIAVIDIGKTNAKLALVDLPTLTEIAVVTRPNSVLNDGPWPHFDTEGHWDFLLRSLAAFHQEHRVDAISITTHGASVVLLDSAGQLAAPILDYEHQIPSQIEIEYDALRPAFTQTGSPRLTGGLNVGAQLHYQFSVDPALAERTAHIVGYPQYWGHRLTGVMSNDVTSIGCHTDLWEPRNGRLSALAEKLEIAEKIAPVRKSGDVLGHLLPAVAQQTGLPVDTPVVCGIHDSNASLYPHLLTQEGPFSVVSTGTWVIVMSVGGQDITLNPERDTLMNVNAIGQPVPSARFMGGREYELILQGAASEMSDEDVQQVLSNGTMLLPAVEPNTGPFQNQTMRWIGGEPSVGTGVRAVVLSYYLALMTETCLRLTGADGPIIIEGPFARNKSFLSMLHAVSGRTVLRSHTATGTSIGAALLCGGSEKLAKPDPIDPVDNRDRLSAYALAWLEHTRAV